MLWDFRALRKPARSLFHRGLMTHLWGGRRRSLHGTKEDAGKSLNLYFEGRTLDPGSRPSDASARQLELRDQNLGLTVLVLPVPALASSPEPEDSSCPREALRGSDWQIQGDVRGGSLMLRTPERSWQSCEEGRSEGREGRGPRGEEM